MSSEQSLTRHIDYRRSALSQAQLSGSLSLSELSRTAEVVVPGSDAEVAASIVVDEDAQRRVKLSGRVQTTLVLPCQRCLQPTEQPIDVVIGGIVVASDEAAAAVPREYEPIMAGDGTLDLHALVDDELLLALPMTVQCDRPDCRAVYDREPEPPAEPSTSDKPNPFAALASLKSDDDKSR